jgi:hypothetical protein
LNIQSSLVYGRRKWHFKLSDWSASRCAAGGFRAIDLELTEKSDGVSAKTPRTGTICKHGIHIGNRKWGDAAMNDGLFMDETQPSLEIAKPILTK